MGNEDTAALAEKLAMMPLEKNFRGDPNDHMCTIGDQRFFYGYGWIIHEAYAGWVWYPQDDEERVPDGPLRSKLERAFPGTEDKEVTDPNVAAVKGDMIV